MDLSPFLISVLSIFLIFGSPASIHAQQPYVGKATTDCTNADNSTSVLGYTCNGFNRSCQAYLTFRSLTPYNSVSSISALFGASPSQLSRLNSVAENSTLETDKLVLIPVNCSCSGDDQYYEYNTSYVVQGGDTYLSIANNTFQGLSTCQALQARNSNLSSADLSVGSRVTVPLRCACPTKNQTDGGVNYLLSYLIATSQDIPTISSMFGVVNGSIVEANELSDEKSTIYPFTTLLVPLQNPPSISQTIAPPPPPPSQTPPPFTTLSPNNNSSNKTWVYVVVGVVGGGVLILVTGFIIFCLFFRKRKKKTDSILTSESFEAIEKPNEKKLEEEYLMEFLDSISSMAQSLKVYTFQELQSATQNFSPSHWIKGSVYRGTINGDPAAIKRMNGDVTKEISVLNKISHLNLIRLSGVCFNQGNWYLVYEYAVNGPLSDWIYLNNGNQKFLNWNQRMQIASDVAMGLNYIHNYTSPPFVHKDVKSSNVLLDSDFRAKIAKFGLARSADGQEGEFALTRQIVGTKGYMAPEYLENGLVSTKLDVYSFGVLLLEILTGKEVSALYEGVNGNLSDVLQPVIHEENVKENLSDFMDSSLQGNYPAELAVLVATLVDSCLRKDPSGRPGMDEIAQSLSRIMTTSLNWELSSSISGCQSFS